MCVCVCIFVCVYECARPDQLCISDSELLLTFLMEIVYGSPIQIFVIKANTYSLVQ